jgi:hydroxycarboxylate dehydrogenase B
MAQDFPTRVVAVEPLRKFVADIFTRAGCDGDEGERIASHLVSANLAGHDSHGVIRTPRYVKELQDGKVLAGKRIEIVKESPTHALVDGALGFGQTIGEQTVDLGIAKARASGLSVIALRNSGHLGRIGDWGERAAEAGLVSIHFVNVQAGELVAPFGGVDRRFSTNPFCVGVPSMDGAPPLLLDFATSVVAEGKVLVASNGGKPVPPDALIEPDGRLSGNPATLYGPITPDGPRNAANGAGALRAFGDHKGSGIAFMCEILAGVLSNGGTSGPIPGGKRTRITNGMLSIYLDPNHFGEPDFLQRAREYTEYVKASRAATPGVEVLVPGEPESRARAMRLRDGIPLQIDTWNRIVTTARSLGVLEPNA